MPAWLQAVDGPAHAVLGAPAQVADRRRRDLAASSRAVEDVEIIAQEAEALLEVGIDRIGEEVGPKAQPPAIAGRQIGQEPLEHDTRNVGMSIIHCRSLVVSRNRVWVYLGARVLNLNRARAAGRRLLPGHLVAITILGMPMDPINVAALGGGITGVSAANHLTAADFSTILFEKGDIGSEPPRVCRWLGSLSHAARAGASS